MISFSEALEAIKHGDRVARTGWNGKGMYIFYWLPAFDSSTSVRSEPSTKPYLIMKTADGEYVPWLASQTDVLADDWVVLEREMSNDPR